MITAETVRTALHATWGAQACQNLANWPDCFEAAMRPNDSHRTSYRERYEAAIEVLTAAYSAGAPADGEMLIWRCFAHLDHPHHHELHRKLTALAEAPAKARSPALLSPAAE